MSKEDALARGPRILTWFANFRIAFVVAVGGATRQSATVFEKHLQSEERLHFDPMLLPKCMNLISAKLLDCR